MPKASPDLAGLRRKEIIAACRELYKTMSFQEITIKDIGAITSCTRTSIYNYFQTKEEIFLALLQEEYELWNDDMTAALCTMSALTPDSLADMLARTLSERGMMLKLLSANLFYIEKNSRLERLVELKVSYGECLATVEKCLGMMAPELSAGEREDMMYAVFALIFGIYPYTHATEKQVRAMKMTGTPHKDMTIYDLVYSAVRLILSGHK